MEECQYCEPATKKMMPYLRTTKEARRDGNAGYRIRIGKGWKGTKFRGRRLMLINYGRVDASIPINYCPFCGRRLAPI